MGGDFIKVGELVRDAVYLIPVFNIKKWYNINYKIKKEKQFQVEYCYFNSGKGKINK